MSKGGKSRSVDVLIADLLANYESMGGKAFLRKWALHSHVNLRKFIEILFRFAPQPEVFAGDLNMQIISAVPRMDDSEKGKRIKELEDQVKEKDDELYGYRASVHVKDVEEIEHEPVRPLALEEHCEKKPVEMTDKELDLEIERIQKELRK